MFSQTFDIYEVYQQNLKIKNCGVLQLNVIMYEKIYIFNVENVSTGRYRYLSEKSCTGTGQNSVPTGRCGVIFHFRSRSHSKLNERDTAIYIFKLVKIVFIEILN